MGSGGGDRGGEGRGARVPAPRTGGSAIAPVDAGELEPYLEQAPRLLRFGPGGATSRATRSRVVEGGDRGRWSAPPLGEGAPFISPFAEAYNLTKPALAAIAGRRRASVPTPRRWPVRAADIRPSPGSVGERIELAERGSSS